MKQDVKTYQAELSDEFGEDGNGDENVTANCGKNHFLGLAAKTVNVDDGGGDFDLDVFNERLDDLNGGVGLGEEFCEGRDQLQYMSR